MSRIVWEEEWWWVWIVFGLALNALIGRFWGKRTASSSVVVLLRVVESCWEYLEKCGVFGKGDVFWKVLVFQKVLALLRLLLFRQGVVDAGNSNKFLGL